MNPKTKYEKQVVKLSKQLPELTEAQKKWGINKSRYPILYHNQKYIWCSECGKKITKKEVEALENSQGGVTCPHCGQELKYDSREYYGFKHNYHNGLCFIQTLKNHTVIRYCYCNTHHEKTTNASYEFFDAFQIWFSPNGKMKIMSRDMCSSYYAWFNFYKAMSIKKCLPRFLEYNATYINVYPLMKVNKTIKRNGFTGKFHDIKPDVFFKGLLSNPGFEYLLKTKQFTLLKYMSDTNFKYINVVRLCKKNGYLIDNPRYYFDYIQMIERLGKDIHSPRWICPKDLKKAHDNANEKLAKIREKERMGFYIEKCNAYEDEYAKEKERFFDLSFQDQENDIIITPLKTVREFLDEYLHMHHCVWSNEYYKKKDSLILSAKQNGVRLETIEVSLNSFNVLQCYGAHNQFTEKHDLILKLINANMNLIKEAC